MNSKEFSYNESHDPKRKYFFSDTFGGSAEWDPLSLPDPDAQISTDFSGSPLTPCERRFDTYGQERVTDHLLRLILQQFDELARRPDISGGRRQQALRLGTGVFINYAPRTSHSNAQPFYVATARGGNIRIVSTPLEALSAIKGEIETLHHLPNPERGEADNGLYDWTQQFRSKLTPILLDPDHGLDLIEDDPADIPAPDNRWHIAFVDRFGNVISYTDNPEDQWGEIETLADRVGDSRREIRLLLDGHETVPLTLATSLGSAHPGGVSIYRNGGIDLVRKWQVGETASERLAQSAFRKLGNPTIGTTIEIAPNA